MKKTIIFLASMVLLLGCSFILCGCDEEYICDRCGERTPVLYDDSYCATCYYEDSYDDSYEVEMYYVDSSAFDQVGYDYYNEELYVMFDSGELYMYSGVPEWLYEDFIYSDSLGGYYNDYIKGQYPSEHL